MNQKFPGLNSIKDCSLWIFFNFMLFGTFHSYSQAPNAGHQLSKQQSWQLPDFEKDTVYGASVNRANKELLAGKTSQPVIVAVIDEGVDIGHEDLQGHIWTNKREIIGNSIDDDRNGYIDDFHGWNFFLGGEWKEYLCDKQRS